MKEKTNAVFIKIDSTYSAKNALEEHVLTKLRKLDNLLCDTLFIAKLEIKTAIEKAKKECPTTNRCKPLKTEYWSFSGDSKSFRVNDVIRMSIHPVYTKNQ
jgi:hypothetical protein